MLRYVATLLCLLLCFPAAYAQQQQGDVELQFTGALQSTFGTDDFSTTTAIMLSKLGYFVTDRLQLGAYPGLTLTRVSVQTPSTTLTDTDFDVGVGVFAVYSFLAGDATTVPYLGTQYYQSDLFEGGFADSWAGVNAGVKLFVNRYTAFDLGGNLLFRLETPDRQMILLQVGLSFLL